MLGSYGLLGIFVYCEHKAGSPPPHPTPPHPTPPYPILPFPTHMFILGPCASSLCGSCENQWWHTYRPGEPGGWRGGGVLAGDCGSLGKRCVSLPGSFHQHCPKTQVTKQGWSLFPEASAASDLSTIFCDVFIFFVHGFLININAAFVFVFKRGGCPSFSCKRSPPPL